MKMNKLLCVLAGAFALSCGAAQANNMENDEYNGWFNGSGPVDHTVSEIKEDAAPFQLVELDGNLVRVIAGETYVFQDKTGEVVVNIPNEVFVGQVVNANTPVKIQGEVRPDMAQPDTVDVYTLDVVD